MRLNRKERKGRKERIDKMKKLMMVLGCVAMAAAGAQIGTANLSVYGSGMQIGVYNHANADWREETDKNLYGGCSRRFCP